MAAMTIEPMSSRSSTLSAMAARERRRCEVRIRAHENEMNAEMAQKYFTKRRKIRFYAAPPSLSLLRHSASLSPSSSPPRLGARHGTCRPDLAGRLAALTERIGLPVRRPDGLDRQRMIAAVGLDKKRMGGGVAFVVPTADGSGVLHGLDAGEALAELDAED
jgi:hypothetical protein